MFLKWVLVIQQVNISVEDFKSQKKKQDGLITEHLLWARCFPSGISLTLTIILESRYSYHLCFLYKEIQAQGVESFAWRFYDIV